MKRPIRLHFWQTDPEFQCNVHAIEIGPTNFINVVDVAWRCMQ